MEKDEFSPDNILNNAAANAEKEAFLQPEDLIMLSATGKYPSLYNLVTGEILSVSGFGYDPEAERPVVLVPGKKNILRSEDLRSMRVIRKSYTIDMVDQLSGANGEMPSISKSDLYEIMLKVFDILPGDGSDISNFSPHVDPVGRVIGVSMQLQRPVRGDNKTMVYNLYIGEAVPGINTARASAGVAEYPASIQEVYPAAGDFFMWMVDMGYPFQGWDEGKHIHESEIGK